MNATLTDDEAFDGFTLIDDEEREAAEEARLHDIELRADGREER